MNTINMSAVNLLNEMQAMAETAAGKSAANNNALQGPESSFGNALSKAIEAVNQNQMESSKLKTAYTMGDKNVSLVDVMVSGQKANVSFNALVTVRNKVIESYQDIMKMPI